MAVYHGKTAKVSFSSSIEAILSWAMSTSADIAKSSVMHASVHWDTNEVGFDDATATIDGNGRKTRDAVAQIGAEAALQLYIDATKYFAFNAICVGITETANKDDVGKISYSFEMDDSAGVIYN